MKQIVCVMHFVLIRSKSSSKLLKVMYSDSKSSAVVNAEDLSMDMAGDRLYAFGNVSTEEGPKSLQVGECLQ